MRGLIEQWISALVILIFIYLVVRNAPGASQVIKELSSANTNAILALQGNRPGLA